MFTTIDDTLNWIHDLLPHGIKPGTTRVSWMLEQLQHPERRLKIVHVAGTNGKGSTVSFLRHIYQEAGYKIGTFTSPYMTAFNERISVNGVGISDRDLIDAANIVKPLVDELAHTELGMPTEFEVITTIAFYYFGKVNICDLILLEVGLGGRLDSTNVVFPLVTVITSIGIDHTKQLGESIEEIAFEKAGIIKSGVPVITAVDQNPALSVIQEKAKKKQAKLYQLGKQIKVTYHAPANGRELFDYESMFTKYDQLKLNMLGKHQIQNAALALTVIDLLYFYYAFDVEEGMIRRGLEKVVWPGRFEKISEQPLVILDGAHNEAGIAALVNTINRYYQDKQIHILYAALSDKDNRKMIRQLDHIAQSILFTQFNFQRVAKAHDLYDLSSHPNKKEYASWQDALETLMGQWSQDQIIIVAGSLYFISEVRSQFQNKKSSKT